MEKRIPISLYVINRHVYHLAVMWLLLKYIDIPLVYRLTNKK